MKNFFAETMKRSKICLELLEFFFFLNQNKLISSSTNERLRNRIRLNTSISLSKWFHSKKAKCMANIRVTCYVFIFQFAYSKFY